ncbi:MAG: transcriptional repressor [Clostridia bacterium]
MKYSKQREQILEYIKSVTSHPTAEIVYTQLRKKIPNISLGTVYRNLDRLSEENNVVRIKFSGAKDRFDGNTNHHYHAVCIKCGEVTDIFIDYFSDIDKKVEKYISSKVISHNTIFNIVCSKCNK